MTILAKVRRQRGVSMIEALVALGVMAFGMLAIVGVQATLRSNGDLARQRNEALRIAQETIESARRYSAIESAAGANAYDDIAASASNAVDLSGTALSGRVSTTFNRTVVGPEEAASSPRMKAMTVIVDWADRTGGTQFVQLNTAIHGSPPELGAALAVPPAREPLAAPRGRHRSVPIGARELAGTGTSVFVPPQPTTGTVAWVFNNTTGLLTGLCTVAEGSTTSSLTPSDVAGCSSNTTAQLLSGYVRFASTATAPTEAEAELPTGLPLNLDVTLTLVSPSDYPSVPVCFDDAAAVTAPPVAAGAVVTYYCAIFSKANFRWAGRSRIAPVGGWVIGTAAGQYKICRYTTLAADTGANNAEHPLDYTEAGSAPKIALNNQNFLVISSAHTCPVDVVGAGDFVNSSTRLHQDGSATYSN